LVLKHKKKAQSCLWALLGKNRLRQFVSRSRGAQTAINLHRITDVVRRVRAAGRATRNDGRDVELDVVRSDGHGRNANAVGLVVVFMVSFITTARTNNRRVI